MVRRVILRRHPRLLELPKGPTGLGRIIMGGSVGASMVPAEDHAGPRVEEIRRDSSPMSRTRLKTPVGICCCSSAIIDARDLEAVARFGERIRVESDRLGRLVKEIVDLSRLQVRDTSTRPEPVDLGSGHR